MWAVAETFGSVLDSIALPFPTQHREGDGGFGAGITEALDHQTAIAKRMRDEQDTEDVAAEPRDIEDSEPAVELLTEEAVLLLQSIAPTVSDQGPLALAKALARAATLNADQMGAVALVANAMETA